MTLAFTLETLNVPADYFTEFALCVGKQNEEAATFKNNMQNLTLSSKLLASKPPSDRSTLERLELENTFSNHIELYRLVTQFKRQVQNELNADLFLLFNEKKYKEIYAFYQKTEKNQIVNWIKSATPLFEVITALTKSS